MTILQIDSLNGLQNNKQVWEHFIWPLAVILAAAIGGLIWKFIIKKKPKKETRPTITLTFDIHHYLMEMGWDFIDDIVWMKPEASVKNRSAMK
ncbi:MAG: hypothetical protein HY841_01180 [Bacteroidetes bacterium]|nr:hypothetical protein [Bacteroidota bacterium]